MIEMGGTGQLHGRISSVFLRLPIQQSSAECAQKIGTRSLKAPSCLRMLLTNFAKIKGGESVAKTTALMKRPQAELHYDQACREIEQAKTMDEVKSFSSKAEAIRVYARLMKDRQLQIDAIDVRGRAERKWAQLHEELKAKGGQPYQAKPTGSKKEPVETAPPTLEELGVDKKESAAAHKLAKMPEEKFEEVLAAWRAVEEKSDGLVGRDILNPSKRPRGTFGTGENEWYTPVKYLELARKIMGAIDLDPATSKFGQKLVQAAKFFTRKEDGLKQEWHGRIWLNPPYSPPDIGNFVKKLIEEFHAGRMTQAILLTHNYTDTAWFQGAASAGQAICFTNGRVRFFDQDENEASPTQGQAFTYFGDDAGVKRFADEFKEVGFVVLPYRG